jgi:hypothetical protein
MFNWGLVNLNKPALRSAVISVNSNEILMKNQMKTTMRIQRTCSSTLNKRNKRERARITKRQQTQVLPNLNVEKSHNQYEHTVR